MRTFKDATGREWTIALNLGSALAIKDRLGVDLLQPERGNPPVLTRLGTDEFFLAEVICTLIVDQFEKQQVTEEEVRGAFDGATILAAQTAFYGELADFFRQRGRTDRAKAVEKQEALIAAGTAAAERKYDALDVETEAQKAVDEAMNEAMRGPSSGASPAGSESTPAP